MLRRLIVGGFLSLLAVFGITTFRRALRRLAARMARSPGTAAPRPTRKITPVSQDVSHQTARAGQPLIAFPNSDTDKALDFVALLQGTSTVSGTELMLRWYMAPRGRRSPPSRSATPAPTSG
jgi:hypothetical protein